MKNKDTPSSQYLDSLLEKLKCVKCDKSLLSLNQDKSQICCENCQEEFKIINGVLDTLNTPSKATLNEIKGMALENSYKESDYKSFQVRVHDSVDGFTEKLNSTKDQHSHYYLQTQMNYEQILSEIDINSALDVLEIGSCHDYYFLNPFHNKGCDCYAVNLHYDLVKINEYDEWPKKIIADMNDLPFKDKKFDIVIISATSHHSTTPEVLSNEIYRILKPGGKCLMINDPTWGLIKNLGGPDNTIAYRESHINENEYSIWRYNKMFKKSGFKYKHYFSSFYDQKLSNLEIHPETRFALLARVLKAFWKFNWFRTLFKKFMLWPMQAIFGFPMNVLLIKK